MSKKRDFAVFILSHGRPDNVKTLKTLDRCGYTGKTYVVVDDKDPTIDQYKENFKDRLLIFSKDEVSKLFDSADTSEDRRTVVYARNACWRLAESLNLSHFWQLDDDYVDFAFRFDAKQHFGYWPTKSLDEILEVLLDFLDDTPTLSVCMAQGGDFMGGPNNPYVKHLVQMRRKAMNSFLCRVDRPFMFKGRVNEDVNTYVDTGNKGGLFFTVMQLQLQQQETQKQKGGMTESYLDAGTYIKSFYTVMFQPSSVQITPMGWAAPRLHHVIDWRKAVPKIVPESFRKPRG